MVFGGWRHGEGLRGGGEGENHNQNTLYERNLFNIKRYLKQNI